MDITILFKACVKTVQTTNKSLGNSDNKSTILRTIRRDEQLRPAKDIAKQIANVHNFILDNKLAYLNVVSYLSTNKTMSEFDREQVDVETQKVINLSANLIKEYKQNIGKSKQHSKQLEEHYGNVVESLQRYLKAVSNIYTETKAVRVKRVIEAHKLSKLETNKTDVKAINQTPKESLKPEDASSNSKEIVDFLAQVISSEDQPSSEEMQMFEMENEHLYNELNSLSEEVKQIESKVVHISELQELFTEKVLQQERDIERIATTVATSTDNMRDANKQIRQAIQRNAGSRVWIMFFLLLMSFCLLFLNWYNR